jgi:hypothetical protein
MKVNYLLLLTAVALLPWATGCPKPAAPTADAGHEEHAEHEGEEHGHSHGEEETAMFWHFEDQDAGGGYLVSIGQHGPHLHAGEEGEAAVSVTKDGQPVTDAKVFVTVLDEAGTAELVAEKAAEYEASEDPPHYAVVIDKVPDGKVLTLKYRVELPDGTKYEKTAPAETVKH